MSDLVGNPEDRFSHIAAHMIVKNLCNDINCFFLGENIISEQHPEKTSFLHMKKINYYKNTNQLHCDCTNDQQFSTFAFVTEKV